MSVAVQISDVPVAQVHNESSLSQKLGFAVFSCLAFEGLKSTVSYLAPRAATAATAVAESAIDTVVSTALAHSVPVAVCAGAAGGAIGTALILSPTARETAVRGVRLGVDALSSSAKRVYSTVSGIGSGIAEGVNFIGKKYPSLLGLAAISFSTYLALKANSTYLACQANSCLS